MFKVKYSFPFLLFLFTVSCQRVTSTQQAELQFEDMTDGLKGGVEAEPGKVYKMWETGICGTVESDHIKVTHIIPGSVAEGKIQVGDLVRGMQHKSMGGWGGITKLVRLRLFRIGRDWDWKFYVTVERPSLRGGKGNNLTYLLKIPPVPGNTCHYGPTGFFAERHPDHLVINGIDEGSPSDGKLMKGDVILEVNGQPIGHGAYDQFTEAIDLAESKVGAGSLELTVKRKNDLPDGSTAVRPPKEKVLFVGQELLEDASSENEESKEVKVTLKIEQVGDYSETSPYKCKKVDALISKSADYLVETQNYGKLNWGLLGLLATGEEQYIRVAKDKIREITKPPEDPDAILKSSMYVSWYWGYHNLILTEYYLLTGDKYVLPSIRQLSRTLAAGQDQAGLWGHRMAKIENGRAHGYGVMNQPSLPIFLSLILAEKCGIKDSMVRNAIERTYAHYKKWIGKGSLPYGNHGPGSSKFSNNGTSGSLAIAFSLLGDQEGAEFYGAMSAADSSKILLGHGGPVWNILWSGLGINVLGPEMVKVYNEKVHWLRTVTRTWQGSYLELKGWGSGVNPRGWETGCYLLNLCVNRRNLHITGKSMNPSIWVNEEKARRIVDVGEVTGLSEAELLNALGSPYPPVQTRAAQELAKRDSRVESDIQSLLENGDRNERIGAVYAIQKCKFEGFVDQLLAIVMDEKDDLWVRQLAVKTLGNIKNASQHKNKLLDLLVKEKPYDQPYGELDLDLGRALVKLYGKNPYEKSLDKDLFYRGVLKLLKHRHHTGRQAGMELIEDIPKEDLHRVSEMMIHILDDKDKTYTSYTGAGQMEALKIFYRHGVKESMEYTVNNLKEGRRWKQNARKEILKSFGGEAKYLIPKIKEILGESAVPFVKQIEEAKTTKKMISVSELKKTALY